MGTFARGGVATLKVRMSCASFVLFFMRFSTRYVPVSTFHALLGILDLTTSQLLADESEPAGTMPTKLHQIAPNNVN